MVGAAGIEPATPTMSMSFINQSNPLFSLWVLMHRLPNFRLSAQPYLIFSIACSVCSVLPAA